HPVVGDRRRAGPLDALVVGGGGLREELVRLGRRVEVVVVEGVVLVGGAAIDEDGAEQGYLIALDPEIIGASTTDQGGGEVGRAAGQERRAPALPRAVCQLRGAAGGEGERVQRVIVVHVEPSPLHGLERTGGAGAGADAGDLSLRGRLVGD